MKLVSRRKFIIGEGTALALFPLYRAFHGFYDEQKLHSPATRNLDAPDYHYLDENGADLLFYFINITSQGQRISPYNPSLLSYIVVQVPPQSLHEKYYWEKPLEPLAPTATDEERKHNTERKRAADARFDALRMDAKLSGPSFLVFQLWPNNWDYADRVYQGSCRLCLNESLLDWENDQLFRLVTAEDILDEGYTGKTLGRYKCKEEVRQKAFIGRKNALGISGKYDYHYYRHILDQIFSIKSDTGNDLQLSIFELPAGLLLTPYFANLQTTDTHWIPSLRNNISAGSKASVSVKNYTIGQGELVIKRTVRERYNTELYYKPLPPNTVNSSKKNANGIQPSPLPQRRSLPPTLRAIAAIYEPGEVSDLPPSAICDTAGVKFDCKADTVKVPSNFNDSMGTGYLPTFLDEQELIYLNQIADTTFKRSLFDITVPTTNTVPPLSDSARLVEQADTTHASQQGQEGAAGDKEPTPAAFLFTSMGASLKFHYQNFDTKLIKDPSISLVEYEHHFQDGRDNYIKVARIGLLCPNNEKALHVRIAQRKVRGRKSYMEYKEYVEKIAPAKPYNLDLDVKGCPASPDYKILTKGGGNTAITSKTSVRKVCWLRAETTFRRTPPIRPEGDKKRWFWLKKETAPADDNTVLEADLMSLPVQYYDCNNKPIPKPSEHALLFLRRDFFCDNAGVNAMLCDNPDDASSQFNWNKGRMRIPYYEQEMALLPDDPFPSMYWAPNPEYNPLAPNGPEPELIPVQPEIKNKINQVPVSWIEYYFNIGQPPAGSPDQSVFDYYEHPIYPQMHRARAIIENAQYAEGMKLPSVIEHHEQYLTNGLRKMVGLQWARQEMSAAKLVLKHTQDFVAGQLQDLRGKAEGIISQEHELDKGYENLHKSFGDAAGKVGALLNPNPELINFSLTKAAMSLPSSLPTDKLNDCFREYSSEADRIKAKLDPAHLFKGLNAELFAGIPLKAILKFLAIGEAPVYELNKLKGQISDKLPVEIENNDVVAKALKEVRSLDDTISKLEQDIGGLKDKLDAATQKANGALAQLNASFPDSDRIRSAAQMKFESGKLSLFKNLTSTLEKEEREILHRVEYAKFFNQKVPADWIKKAETRLSSLNALLASTAANKMSDALRGISNVSSPLQREFTDAASKLDDAKSGIRKALGGLTGDLKTKITDLAGRLDGVYAQAATDVDAWKKAMLAAIVSSSVFAEAADFYADADRTVATILKSVDYLEAEYKAEIQELATELQLLARLSQTWYQRYATRLEADAADIISTASSYEAKLIQNVNDFATQGETYAKAEYNALKDSITDVAAAGDKTLQQIVQEQKLVAEKFDALTTQIQNLWNELDQTTYNKWKSATDEIGNYAGLLAQKVKAWETAVAARGKDITNRIDTAFNKALEEVKDSEEVRAARKAYEDLRNLLNALKRQELNYTWQTKNFQPADLGIMRFSPVPGRTALTVNVSTVIRMDPGKFPAVIEGVDTTAYNELSDFSLTFLNAITVVFDKISFRAGSGQHPDVSVAIREVRFDGALSFIQKLQELLSSLFEGFVVEIAADHVSIGYQSPVLNISAPGFAFNNFSFGVRLNVYFINRRPMDITFALASRESKATIAAGIYGGGFFFAATLEPKRGIIAVEMALEMGAYLGISIGPIHGEVRFMVGLYYRKDDKGVVLEGYFIAEGILKFWIISVMARLYMSVRSENSRVTGMCTLSYTVKIGFLKKTIEGHFEKTIKGAESNTPPSQQRSKAAGRALSDAEVNSMKRRADDQRNVALIAGASLGNSIVSADADTHDFLASIAIALAKDRMAERSAIDMREFFSDSFEVLRQEDFNDYCNQYF